MRYLIAILALALAACEGDETTILPPAPTQPVLSPIVQLHMSCYVDTFGGNQQGVTEILDETIVQNAEWVQTQLTLRRQGNDALVDQAIISPPTEFGTTQRYEWADPGTGDYYVQGAIEWKDLAGNEQRPVSNTVPCRFSIDL